MQARHTEISGAIEFTAPVFPDHRGLFVAPFQQAPFAGTAGHHMPLAQINNSVSNRGVIRGIHFADVPPGQAKYVYCASGSLLDVIVDVRTGSPTFGHWEAIRLDAERYNAVYLAEGLGHAFAALADDTVMIYLCSTPYNPPAEHAITPLDPELALPWGELEADPILSEKDQNAPTLAEAAAAGTLPAYQDCLEHYARLRSSG